MTTLTTLWFSEPKFLLSALRWIREVFAGVSEGRATAERYAYLARLSDAELARRGIRREELSQIALSGRLPR